MTDIVKRLRTWADYSAAIDHKGVAAMVTEAADGIETLWRQRADMARQLSNDQAELDAYRKATGGLPPALVANALAFTATINDIELDLDGFTSADIDALQRATFEATDHG